MVSRPARIAVVLAPLCGCALVLGLDPPAFDPAASDAGAEARADAPPDSADASPRPRPEQLTSGQGSVFYLAVDDASVYFTSYDRGLLASVPKNGGAVAYLIPPDSGLVVPSGGVAVDDSYVYVPAYGAKPGVRRITKDGGAGDVVEDCNTVFSLAVDDTNVYWLTAVCGSSSIRLRMRPKADLMAAIQEAPPDDGGMYAYATYGYVAVDATSVYWVNAYELHAADKPLGGGATRKLYAASNTGDVARGIAVDDRVYVVFGTTLLAIDKKTFAPTTLATDIVMGGRVGIATDATHVYYTNPDGRILRVAKSGGAPETLAAGQPEPQGLALDATHVYWSNIGGDGGSIWRVGY